MGLKFRGANAYSLFRNYTSGFVPWYLTGEETRFLALALQQVIEVSKRLEKYPDKLIGFCPSAIFFSPKAKQWTGGLFFMSAPYVCKTWIIPILSLVIFLLFLIKII